MSGSDVLERDNDIDVAGLFGALKRKWWLILFVMLLSGAALFFVLLSISPRYLSTAEVLIAGKTSSATEQIQEGGGRNSDNRLDERAVRTEVEILASDKIALEVIDQLGLVNLSEFQDDAEMQGDLLSFAKEATGNFIKGDGEQDEDKPAEPTVSVTDVARSTALRKFREKLEVYAIDNSQVIRMEFWSVNPLLARNVVEAISERYQDSQVDATAENVARAEGFVNPRIAELRSLIEKERKAVARFESENQIFKTNNGSGDTPGLLVNQELSEASSELSRLRAERSAAQAKIASIRAALNSGSSIDVIPEVLSSQYIQNLRQSEVALEAQISDLSTSLLPQHPQMKALNSQLQRYRSQIRKATQDIITSLENNVQSARNAEKKLAEEIDQLKNEQLKINSLLVNLDGRKKRIAGYEEELQQRLVDSRQVRSRAEIPPAAATIISPASIPDEPYFPKVVPFTVAGMAASGVLTVLAILATSLVTSVATYNANEQYRASHEFDRAMAEEPKLASVTVERPRPLDSIVRAQDGGDGMDATGREQVKPVLANAPDQTHSSAGGYHSADSESVDSENEIIAVRYAASVLADADRGRIVSVSPAGEAGSQTAWILVRQLVAAGRSVVAIDMSGDLATTREMLGTTDVPGVFNLVSGSTGIENVIYRDRRSNAHVVSAGQLFPGTPMPQVEVVSDIVDAIAESYDFCVVDCGDASLEGMELVATDDAIMVISTIDANPRDCEKLEKDLKEAGFRDILQIKPDHADLENEALARV